MTDKPKHTKITTYTVQKDGTVKVSTETYFESLARRKEEVIKTIKTDKTNLMADIISCLDVVNPMRPVTRELHIVVNLDEYHQPKLITKQYITLQEDFDRR